ncbi:biotin/lipoyl-binding protein [Sedimentimonas flavescens]|uniref:Biotin/lipoyl-binding protein n=1 Tax=Sedimentimonas flavescens TaxID=2851012 RepID=A0ABT3A0D7_9RHOB|nr:biotin/lipoyl-binding protein [Sedimentimonas flavescens]MCV2879388.1 biotin/lipoyl-binding protein [Sedimentimonas flavescens]
MLELLFSACVTILPDYLYRSRVQGKQIGHEITLYSVWFELRWGIAGCAILTTALITLIFFYHPETTNVTSFFRTVTILPQTGGRVDEVLVRNGDVVEAGQPLIRLESDAQKAALAAAQSRLAEVDAALAVGASRLAAAEGALEQAQGGLRNAEQELELRQDLARRNSSVVSERDLEALENALTSARGAVNAAEANRAAVEAELTQVLPAQRAAATAAIEQAQVALDQTEIVAGVAGRVEQFALQVGDYVSPVLRPAGILVPSNEGRVAVFQAGFNQLAGQVLHEGMVVEMTCLSKPFAIIPMRITGIQPQVAAGQFRPTDQLVDLAQLRQPGLITVKMEPIWPEMAEGVLPGSACAAMAYTTAPHDSGVFMHIVETVGVVHAAMLRIRALVLPVQALVFSGH